MCTARGACSGRVAKRERCARVMATWAATHLNRPLLTLALVGHFRSHPPYYNRDCKRTHNLCRWYRTRCRHRSIMKGRQSAHATQPHWDQVQRSRRGQRGWVVKMSRPESRALHRHQKRNVDGGHGSDGVERARNGGLLSLFSFSLVCHPFSPSTRAPFDRLPNRASPLLGQGQRWS